MNMENHQEFESILEADPVRLEKFEGPLDLLLHLIKQHEVDIYDIPIAVVTQQYLEYIDLMQELNLDKPLRHAMHVVVGTTGLTDEDEDEIRALLEQEGDESNVFVAPNFALGAGLMALLFWSHRRGYDR